MKEKLKRILRNLNLASRQIKILVACFESSPATAAEISKRTRLEKSTVYKTIEELIEEGYLEQEVARGRKIFRPITPERLKAIVASKQRKMRRLELEVEDLIPKLEEFAKPKIPHKPKIKLYEGKKAQQIIAREIRERGKDRLTIGSDAWFELFPQYATAKKVEKWKKKNIESGAQTKKIVVDSPLTENVRKSHVDGAREVHRFPKNVKFKGALTVYDDKTFIFSQKKDIFVVAIESESVAQMMKVLFRFIWEKTER